MRHRPGPRPLLRFAAVIALLGVVLAGCGDDGGPAAAPTTTSAYPPADFEGLAALFDPELEAFGLRLTRGALIDRTDGAYDESETGDHLALYVEPTGTYTASDYIDGLGTLTAFLTPLVFDRWPALATYDVCQEPPPAEDPAEDTGQEPVPLTQVEFSREQAAAVDWDGFTTEDMLAMGADPDGPRLYVGPDLASEPEFIERRAAALDDAP